MSLLLISRLSRLSNASRLCQKRNTWILQHVYAPFAVKPSDSQRRPEEIQNLMKYEVIRSPKDFPNHKVRVILLEDVEGVGYQFDVMEFDHKFARNELLLPKKAVYASPYDLKYYMKLKEQMKEQIAARVRIPFEYIKLGRELMKKIISINVSIDNTWKINKDVLRASLYDADISAPADTIFLPENYAYTGPNFELEAALLKFYVVINKQYVVPMIGRLAHISTDEFRQSVYPSNLTRPTPEQLEKYGIKIDERPYYHPTSALDADFDVVSLMCKRDK